MPRDAFSLAHIYITFRSLDELTDDAQMLTPSTRKFKQMLISFAKQVSASAVIDGTLEAGWSQDWKTSSFFRNPASNHPNTELEASRFTQYPPSRDDAF
jgi:hypothetical protein